MLRPVPGFVAFPTDHCVTGSLRHVYDHYGYAISEDLLLGLGGGLGFVYFHMKGTDPFARFLDEAASITGEPQLAELASDLTAIGDRWEEVAAAFGVAAQAENPADLLETATKPMQDIADLEQDFWERLDATIVA
jgi:Domain of unknown function (DUF4872)/Butirosin biosynthesis protein H, N-terminal